MTNFVNILYLQQCDFPHCLGDKFHKRMIIRLLYFIIFCSLFTSCSLIKSTTVVEKKQPGGPFMDQVTVMIQPAAATSFKQANDSPIRPGNITTMVNRSSSTPSDIEQYIPAAFRFSLLLDIEVEALKNKTLFEYISRWWATPYRIGGNDFNGIDCSGFIKGLSCEAYEKELPRTSREQSDVCTPITKDELQEGDLVFFKTGRGAVSHVGMYLANNKFVHASTSVGVTISDLDEPYWKNRLVKIGRMLLP